MRISTAQKQGTSMIVKKMSKINRSGAKVQPKIMVWRALSYRGFYLKVLDGQARIGSPKYRQILADFVPKADALYEEGWVV